MKNLKLHFYSLVGLATFFLVASAPAGTWTSTDGRSLEATFVSLDESDNITLKLADGNLVKFPLERLKAADRDVARQFSEGLGDDTYAKTAAKKVDYLLATNLAKQGVRSFNEPLPDDLFARRVYLDIIGRIPTREEFTRFVSNSRVDKRALLIDELLQHPGYAHHLFSYFGDMYRLNGSPIVRMRAEPYINWWFEHLEANTPYDEIVTEMITAEGNMGTNPATGFLLRDAGMELDTFGNFSQIYLGIDISCAQCHDHPFDEWEQIDFYRMAAFFGNTQRQAGRGVIPDTPEGWADDFLAYVESQHEGKFEDRDKRRVTYFGEAFRRSVVDNEEMELRIPNDFLGREKPGDVVKPDVLIGKDAKTGGKTRREALADWLVAPENPRFAMVIANRMWSRAFGRALVEPVGDFGDLSMSGQPEVIEFLADVMGSEEIDYDLKQFMRILYNTEAYQTYATAEQPDLADRYYFQGPILRRLRAEQAWDSLMLLSEGPGIDTKRGRDGSFHVEMLSADLGNLSMEEAYKTFLAFKKYNGRGGAVIDEPGLLNATVLRDTNLRASQLEQPMGASLLDSFGQSDRFVPDDHNFDGAVPQVLELMNGSITGKLTGSGALIVSELEDLDGPDEKVRGVFFTILSRYPDDSELTLGMELINDYGDDGIRDLAWALLNSPEFLYVQ